MTDAEFSLAGRRVLITGGTRGIGRAISGRFARRGCEVIAIYVRDDERARELEAELSAEGGSIRICRADLTTDQGLERVVELIGEQDLSGCIHCAATGVHRPVEELSLRHWDFTFALNLRAFFRLAKALLPRFMRGGSIVAVSSQGAMQAMPDYAAVGSSKAGLEALCRHLAVELAPRGIRVNVLSPGNVLTEAWNAFPDKDARIREAIARSPSGQLTTVEEVACAAQFLCCDASRGISGHTLVVDGGQRIRG